MNIELRAVIEADTKRSFNLLFTQARRLLQKDPAAEAAMKKMNDIKQRLKQVQ